MREKKKKTGRDGDARVGVMKMTAGLVTFDHEFGQMAQNPQIYTTVVYGLARQSYLRKMDSIHNQGLRLALSAFRTSPVSSIC